MDIELINLDKSISFDVLQKYFYYASTDKVDRLCLSSGLLNSFPEAKKIVKLAALIDFPDGLQSISSRMAEVLYSIRSGADYIDITVNNSLVSDGNLNRIKSEYKSYFELCKANKVAIRPILEYRMHDLSTIMHLCEILTSIGIVNFVSSTGRMADDFDDNIITCKRIQDYLGVSVIFCGRLFTKEQLNYLDATGISCARITSLGILENLFDFGNYGV